MQTIAVDTTGHECENVYVNCRHMEQFCESLKADDTTLLSDLNTEAPNSPVVGPQQLPFGQRVRKVSALSDFAPVNLKVKKYAFPDHYMAIPFTHQNSQWQDGDVLHDLRIWAMSGSILHYGGLCWYVSHPSSIAYIS